MALYTYNQGAITIPRGTVGRPGYGTPSPSQIKIKRIKGEITDVSVDIRRLTARRPGDLSIYLNEVLDTPVKGKKNKSLILMSGVGSNFPITNFTLKFSDEGQSLPFNARIGSGSNAIVEAKPTSDNRRNPLRNLPISLSTTTVGDKFSFFDKGDPKGTWQLYIANQPANNNQGSQTATIRSWSLNIVTDYKPRIIVDDSRGREGQGNNKIFFKISLDAASEKPVTINYKTQPGTATRRDYQSVKSSVRFNPGETEKLLAVNIIDDNIRENDETFNLILSTKNRLVRLTDRLAVGTIADNDGGTSQAQSDELLGKVTSLTGQTASLGSDEISATSTASSRLQTVSVVNNISREETFNTNKSELLGNTYNRENCLREIIQPHDLLTVGVAVNNN